MLTPRRPGLNCTSGGWAGALLIDGRSAAMAALQLWPPGRGGMSWDPAGKRGCGGRGRGEPPLICGGIQ